MIFTPDTLTGSFGSRNAMSCDIRFVKGRLCGGSMRTDERTSCSSTEPQANRSRNGDLLRRKKSGRRLGRTEARALRCKDCKHLNLLIIFKNV